MGRAYTAYRTWASKRKLQVKQHLPDRKSLRTYSASLNCDENLQSILESSKPPTLDKLKSLPEFANTDDHAFVVYLLILEKPSEHQASGSGSHTPLRHGSQDQTPTAAATEIAKSTKKRASLPRSPAAERPTKRAKKNKTSIDDQQPIESNAVDNGPLLGAGLNPQEYKYNLEVPQDGNAPTPINISPPLIYIGSGTHMTLGVHQRFYHYDNDEGFSKLTRIAHQHGYIISHRKVLVSTPCPTEVSLILPTRALFLLLETALTYGFCALQDRNSVHPTLTNHQ
ncbi:hypothetical protein B0H65DRAFT_107879 [Neurospora tetraspora]|uniref:Uncharacterized protein n=1 Tax=Neurospora tetraspora TaxID=94610 RepID=A0AAE0JK36_9PEZI|nr:hypothetical protein B0H65DRAFT_107879 [Neurospora tetraspora]